MADHGRQVAVGNEALLREQFAAAEHRENWPRAMELYDDQVVLLVAGDDVPNPGVFTGKENVGRWFAEWLSMFDHIVFDIQTIAHGRDGLAVHARHSARGKESGAEAAVELYYAYWFREGKAIRVEVYGDREPAWRAAGVDE